MTSDVLLANLRNSILVLVDVTAGFDFTHCFKRSEMYCIQIQPVTLLILCRGNRLPDAFFLGPQVNTDTATFRVIVGNIRSRRLLLGNTVLYINKHQNKYSRKSI